MDRYTQWIIKHIKQSQEASWLRLYRSAPQHINAHVNKAQVTADLNQKVILYQCPQTEVGSEYTDWMLSTVSDCPTAPPAGAFAATLQRAGTKGLGQQTHISPGDFCIDVRWHISTAVLLLQLSFAGDQPVLQHGRLLLELLRKRQSLFQVLLPLCYLKEAESVAIL